MKALADHRVNFWKSIGRPSEQRKAVWAAQDRAHNDLAQKQADRVNEQLSRCETDPAYISCVEKGWSCAQCIATLDPQHSYFKPLEKPVLCEGRVPCEKSCCGEGYVCCVGPESGRESCTDAIVGCPRGWLIKFITDKHGAKIY